MNRLLTAFLLTTGAVTSALAVPVGLAEAGDFARAWRGRAVRAARTVRSASGEDRLHVVRFEGGGWAAVGADDEGAPVIAFSACGEDLVEDGRNPLWALVSRDAENRAAQVRARRKGGRTRGVRHAEWTLRRAHPVASLSMAEATVKTAATASSLADLEDVRVAPMIESRWDQFNVNYNDGPYCYNYYTPNHASCGCVPTMAAQVMRYHRWPTASVQAKTVGCFYNGQARNLTMKGGVYNWDLMTLRPTPSTPEANLAEIGKICYDIGVANRTNYGMASSGTYCNLLKDSLVSVFGYAYARFVYYADNYYPFNYTEFKTIVKTNCDAGMPICLGVGTTGSSAGHAVVADGYGYDNGAFYVHINGGWAGYGDAWYHPPSEIFMDGHDLINCVVYNIFPRTKGAIVSGRVLDAAGRPIEGASVSFYTTSSSTKGTVTNCVGTVSTNAKGIYAWITGVETEKAYLIGASHPDRLGDRTVASALVAKTVSAPSSYINTDTSGGYKSPTSSKAPTLGNVTGINFTLDLRRSVPGVLFR